MAEVVGREIADRTALGQQRLVAAIDRNVQKNFARFSNDQPPRQESQAAESKHVRTGVRSRVGDEHRTEWKRRDAQLVPACCRTGVMLGTAPHDSKRALGARFPAVRCCAGACHDRAWTCAEQPVDNSLFYVDTTCEACCAAPACDRSAGAVHARLNHLGGALPRPRALSEVVDVAWLQRSFAQRSNCFHR